MQCPAGVRLAAAAGFVTVFHLYLCKSRTLSVGDATSVCGFGALVDVTA